MEIMYQRDILKKLNLLEIFKKVILILVLIMEVGRFNRTSSGVTTRVGMQAKEFLKSPQHPKIPPQEKQGFMAQFMNITQINFEPMSKNHEASIKNANANKTVI